MDVGFPTSEKVWREKKENKLSPQNIMVAFLSLSLERATIIITNQQISQV